tara:strand:- start:727 stop:1338 length:612 start_codon:yes stop_codon:yes gene_type:complete
MNATQTSMLQNLISTLSNTEMTPVIIGRSADTTHVVKWGAHEWSQINAVSVRREIATILEPEYADYYSLVIAVPREVLEAGVFNSYLEEVDELSVSTDFIREQWPETTKEMTDADILSALSEGRNKTWEEEVSFEYEAPIFYPLIEALGGLQFILENTEAVIATASALINEEVKFTFTPQMFSASEICPEMGRRFKKAFADVE